MIKMSDAECSQLINKINNKNNCIKKVRNKPIQWERIECKEFVKWLQLNKCLFTHIKSENTVKNKIYAKTLRDIGVRPGFPDYVVVKKNKLFFIEMKKLKGLKPSEAQQRWIDTINFVGIVGNNMFAKCCYGWQEAVKFIEENL